MCEELLMLFRNIFEMLVFSKSFIQICTFFLQTSHQVSTSMSGFIKKGIYEYNDLLHMAFLLVLPRRWPKVEISLQNVPY